MAVEKETQLEVWLEENMPEPGGGNPNYVETIEGTLSNPWGLYSFDDIFNGIVNSEITVAMSVQGLTQGLYLPLFISGDESITTQACSYSAGGVPTSAAIVEWYGGDLDTHTIWLDGEVQTLPVFLVTTLKIIHHPLPEN